MTLSEAQDYWKLSDQQVDAIWRLLLAHERILPGGQIGYSMADLEWAIEWLGPKANRGLREADDELQHRHEERQRLLRETMEISEAAKRYGVHAASLNKHLRGVSAWYPSPGVPRYAIADIEEAVERIRRR